MKRRGWPPPNERWSFDWWVEDVLIGIFGLLGIATFVTIIYFIVKGFV